MPDSQRLLVISQVYVPDPAAVGQYIADAAEELARRGTAVRVLTSRRGYADATVQYPAREMLGGVDVVRLPFSSLGKATILHRVVGQLSFLLQVIVRGLFTAKLSGILVSTSPPMAAIAALVIRLFRRVPITYWVMDLNPDQVIATGHMKPGAIPVRMMDWLNRRILSAAARIVPLDRFMADRLRAKFQDRPRRLAQLEPKLTILPPWPMVEAPEEIPHEENPFRQEHGLEGKFVVMYSGNHGMLLPLDTLLEASLRLQDEEQIVFLFIGDGYRKQEVNAFIEEHKPPNVVSLPYQRLDQLKYSLSAADVHAVTMTDNMVGIIHPCKIYGAMSVGRPILFVGPQPSHVTDLLEKHECGWRIAHGDVAGAEKILRQAAQERGESAAMGAQGKAAMTEELNTARLRSEFCDLLMREA